MSTRPEQYGYGIAELYPCSTSPKSENNGMVTHCIQSATNTLQSHTSQDSDTVDLCNFCAMYPSINKQFQIKSNQRSTGQGCYRISHHDTKRHTCTKTVYKVELRLLQDSEATIHIHLPTHRLEC